MSAIQGPAVSIRRRSGGYTIVCAFGLALLLTACAGGKPSDESATTDQGSVAAPLRVYAAASLSGSLTAMADRFEELHPDVEIAPIVFDGSATLANQIVEGAPADLFISADQRTVTELGTKVDFASAPSIIATNTLTIAVAPNNPLGITSLNDLSSPELVVVLCAPEVPCGAASFSLLALDDTTVSPASEEQSVSAVLQKVISGEADAGLVYATDAVGAADKVDSITPAKARSVVNEYPAVVLAESANQDQADTFIDFLLSDEGQAMLTSYGFGPQ